METYRKKFLDATLLSPPEIKKSPTPPETKKGETSPPSFSPIRCRIGSLICQAIYRNWAVELFHESFTDQSKAAEASQQLAKKNQDAVQLAYTECPELKGWILYVQDERAPKFRQTLWDAAAKSPNEPVDFPLIATCTPVRETASRRYPNEELPDVARLSM